MFASQYAETLYKTCNLTVIIGDRDSVIASAGVSKKEYGDMRLSASLEEIMEGRSAYEWRDGENKLSPISGGSNSHFIRCAMPIISEGDVVGCVVSLCASEGENKGKETLAPDVELKLVMTAASFLGKQMEN